MINNNKMIMVNEKNEKKIKNEEKILQSRKKKKKKSKFRALRPTCLLRACGPWEASIFYPWVDFRIFFENIEKMERIYKKNMNIISQKLKKNLSLILLIVLNQNKKFNDSEKMT